MKDRALPHIGRDAVKFSSPDGAALLSSCGDTRAGITREPGELADDSHSFRKS
jgi:hypothetical protein